jgi:gluconolactonase
MFYKQAPECIQADVFTEMPGKFRRTGVRSAWADANRGCVAMDSFLEGPVFDSQGNLYVTDIIFGRVFRIDPKGDWTQIVEYDGEPNGMKLLSDDALLITDYKNGLMRLAIQSGKVEPYFARRNTESFKGVNDLTCDSQGNIYFTDQGQSGMHDPTGRVYRLQPSGKLDLLLSNVPSPNGLVLSPDEKVLYVAATRGNCVWRTPLMSDGSVAKVGQFFTTYGPSGPDGLAVDVAGNLAIANPGLGYVWLINPRGEPIFVWTSPKGNVVTNVAFGGVENRDLYCTESESGSILVMRAPHPGAKVHRPLPSKS